MSIVRVALDLPLSGLFDYSMPDGVQAVVGQRVVVPFGRKQLVGVAMELATASDLPPDRIKPIARILDDVPPLPGEILHLLRFCSDYYHHALGATVMTALPTRLRSTQPLSRPDASWVALSAAGRAMNADQIPKRNTVQRRIFEALQSGPHGMVQLRAVSSSASAALKVMQEAGWIEPCAPPDAAGTSPGAFAPVHLPTAEQGAAIAAIGAQQGYACFLLHGVTGSGKTEVYVHAMHQALGQGGQVLLLVPEINLTPQLESYFRARFPDTELVSLHSGLAEGVRAQNWLRAQSGEARIILGTRLAVFAPLPKLALIAVDEEHDASYKQQDGLHYSARDVAIFRARQRNVPIVLGSATPSLESYHNARSGRYKLLQLDMRAAAQAQLPAVRCIDISQATLHEGLGERLLSAIAQRLERREQSLVFINRRGYAPVLLCSACGWLSACPHCAGKLVLHLQDRCLRCHHCGHQQRVPPACPSCGNADLRPVGAGTQRIETALQERFPRARILRVDRDSTRNKGAWDDMRRQIQDHAVDILVGTQILAKGHDFPNITLVGVLNPDGALYSSDFRASEKLFAQLSQVAGRAGRAGKPGEVLVQTQFPGHPLFRALSEHDFNAWAEILLAERRTAGFPPFVYQAMLRAEDSQEAAVYAFLREAREAAIALDHQVDIYAPVPAAMPRRAGHIRAQLLVQSAARKPLQQFLHAWRPLLEQISVKRIRWSLDVDPVEF